MSGLTIFEEGRDKMPGIYEKGFMCEEIGRNPVNAPAHEALRLWMALVIYGLDFLVNHMRVHLG